MVDSETLEIAFSHLYVAVLLSAVSLPRVCVCVCVIFKLNYPLELTACLCQWSDLPGKSTGKKGNQFRQLVTVIEFVCVDVAGKRR